MGDISASGLVVSLFASNSAPLVPWVLTNFADNEDPFDFDDLVIANDGMGLNGDYIWYTSPTPIRPTLRVIPGSQSDIILSTLLELNRVGEDKAGAGDVITMTSQYPGRSPIILSGGGILSGSPAPSAASDGRIKTKQYKFGFGNKIGIGE